MSPAPTRSEVMRISVSAGCSNSERGSKGGRPSNYKILLLHEPKALCPHEFLAAPHRGADGWLSPSLRAMAAVVIPSSRTAQ